MLVSCQVVFVHGFLDSRHCSLAYHSVPQILLFVELLPILILIVRFDHQAFLGDLVLLKNLAVDVLSIDSSVILIGDALHQFFLLNLISKCLVVLFSLLNLLLLHKCGGFIHALLCLNFGRSLPFKLYERFLDLGLHNVLVVVSVYAILHLVHFFDHASLVVIPEAQVVRRCLELLLPLLRFELLLDLGLPLHHFIVPHDGLTRLLLLLDPVLVVLVGSVPVSLNSLLVFKHLLLLLLCFCVGLLVDLLAGQAGKLMFLVVELLQSHCIGLQLLVDVALHVVALKASVR